jgi:hypothetical protein
MAIDFPTLPKDEPLFIPGHIPSEMINEILSNNDADDAAKILLALQGKTPAVAATTHESSRDTHIELGLSGAAFWISLAWLISQYLAAHP